MSEIYWHFNDIPFNIKSNAIKLDFSLQVHILISELYILKKKRKLSNVETSSYYYGEWGIFLCIFIWLAKMSGVNNSMSTLSTITRRQCHIKNSHRWRVVCGLFFRENFTSTMSLWGTDNVTLKILLVACRQNNVHNWYYIT